MTISTLLAVGVIILQVFIVGVVFDLIWGKVTKKQTPGLKFLHKHGQQLAFLFSLGAVGGSLLYSEVVGFIPCDLCWWQRIFLYPIVIILGISLWKKDRKYGPLYALALSGVATVVALYHTYLQYGGSPIGNCGVGEVSCVQRIVYEFGYITLPMMSLTVSIAILLALVVYLKRNK